MDVPGPPGAQPRRSSVINSRPHPSPQVQQALSNLPPPPLVQQRPAADTSFTSLRPGLNPLSQQLYSDEDSEDGVRYYIREADLGSYNPENRRTQVNGRGESHRYLENKDEAESLGEFNDIDGGELGLYDLNDLNSAFESRRRDRVHFKDDDDSVSQSSHRKQSEAVSRSKEYRPVNTALSKGQLPDIDKLERFF
jgi:hypothetical protein